MIITCPACTKRYLVDDTAVDEAGRQVHCAVCNHEWFFKPVKESASLDHVQFDAMGPSVAQNVRHASRHLTWLLSITSLILIGAALYFGRYTISTYSATAAQIYRMIGLEPTLQDQKFVFQNVVPYMDEKDPHAKLIIRGELLNTGKTVLSLKPLKIKVKGNCSYAPSPEQMKARLFGTGQKSCVLKEWTYYPAGTRLFPGEKLNFETQSTDPIKGAESIKVTF